MEKLGINRIVPKSFFDKIKNIVEDDIISFCKSHPKLTITVGSSLCAVLVYYAVGRKNDTFKDIPGPPSKPFLGNFMDFPSRREHLYFERLSKKYGKICKVKIFIYELLVVSSLEAIQEVLVEKSLDFAGRSTMFAMNVTI